MTQADHRADHRAVAGDWFLDPRFVATLRQRGGRSGGERTPHTPRAFASPALAAARRAASAVGSAASAHLGEYTPASVGRDAGGGGGGKPYDQIGAAAIIDVSGPVFFGFPDAYWFGGLTHGELVAACEFALADDSVERVAFVWHCPGGHVAGSGEMVAAIDRLSAAKQTLSLVYDTATSLAQLGASATRRVFVTSTGVMGSIGAVAHAVDEHEHFARMGLTTHVYTDAQIKAAGAPGVEIPEAYHDNERERLGEYGRQITQGVASRMGLDPETVRSWQGRLFTGAACVAAGLAEAVTDVPAFFDLLLAPSGAAASTTTTTTTTTPTTPTTSAGKRPAAKGPDMSTATASANIPTDDDIKAMTDEERKDLAARLMGEDGEDPKAEGEDEDPKAEGKDEDPKAEGGDDDDDAPKAASGSPAATFGQLDEAIPAKVPQRDALIAKAMRSRWTVAKAQAHAMESMADMTAEASARAEQARDLGGDLATSETKIPAGDTATGTASARWAAAISETAEKRTGGDRVKATSIVAREQPSLRAAVLEEGARAHAGATAR